MGTLYLEDPWGSESWKWAQAIQPLLPVAMVWAIFGELKDSELKGKRHQASTVTLIKMLKQYRLQLGLAAGIVLGECAFLLWMQAYDVLIIIIIALATVGLQIEPGKRTTTPLFRRSRTSAMGSGFMHGRSDSSHRTSVIISLDKNGLIAPEDSIYLNPCLRHSAGSLSDTGASLIEQEGSSDNAI